MIAQMMEQGQKMQEELQKGEQAKAMKEALAEENKAKELDLRMQEISLEREKSEHAAALDEHRYNLEWYNAKTKRMEAEIKAGEAKARNEAAINAAEAEVNDDTLTAPNGAMTEQ